MSNFSRLSTLAVIATLAIVVTVAVPASAAAQTCGPLNNGRIADVFYEGTALYFDPVVEYTEMVLTITGPCEDIVRTFGSKDQISFDIREIDRVVDGRYNWQLKRVAPIDPAVREDLQSARHTGEEDALWWSYFQKGVIPAGPYTDSGTFTVLEGQIIDPGSGVEEKSAVVASRGLSAPLAATAAGFHAADTEQGANQIVEKQTIAQSLCVGFDCPSSPTFSDSTILMMENNTRIKFDDTSTAGSFPRNDWEIEANSNLNGGGSWLGFNDCGESSQGGCATDLVFAVEAGARQYALYVENSGEVGIGTNNPVLELHAVSGDTPGLRLEQDVSSGFAAQTWDLAGNETSFFLRDATNGSTLPFRVFPGSSSNILVVRNDNVGIGTTNPTARLHVVESSGNADLLFDASASTNVALDRGNTSSLSRLQLLTAGALRWSIGMVNDTTDDLHIGPSASTTHLFIDQSSGDVGIGTETPQGKLDVDGAIYQRGGVLHADYVFDPSYELESIDEHADFMWANKHLPAMPKATTDDNGLEVVEIGAHRRGMLEELEKAHIYIEQLNDSLRGKDEKIDQLQDRLARVEELLATRGE